MAVAAIQLSFDGAPPEARTGSVHLPQPTGICSMARPPQAVKNRYWKCRIPYGMGKSVSRRAIMPTAQHAARHLEGARQNRVIGALNRDSPSSALPAQNRRTLESGNAVPGGFEDSSSWTCSRVGSPRQRAGQKTRRQGAIAGPAVGDVAPGNVCRWPGHGPCTGGWRRAAPSCLRWRSAAGAPLPVPPTTSRAAAP